MTQTTDILIIGSGPGGATLAYLLAQAGRDVTLVDRAAFPRDKICGDGLTPRAIQVIRRVGLNIDEVATEPVDDALMVSPSGLQATLNFPEAFGPRSGGRIVPRLKFDAWLHGKAVAAGARFVQATWQKHLREGKTVVGGEFKTASGPLTIKAGLTVIATGAFIAPLKELGVIRVPKDPIVAVRTYFDNVPKRPAAFEFYFEKDLLPGYGWIFPTEDGRANVGVGVFAAWLGRKRPPINALLDQFLAAPHVQERLRGATEAGPRRSHPLRVDFPAHAMTGDGWLIVGESAGLVNPNTGEGIDLAIESAELAAETLLKLKQQKAYPRRKLLGYELALHRRFTAVFQGTRVLQRFMLTERVFNAVIRRSNTDKAFRKTAIHINLGLATPLAILHPRILWSIFAPKYLPSELVKKLTPQ